MDDLIYQTMKLGLVSYGEDFPADAKAKSDIYFTDIRFTPINNNQCFSVTARKQNVYPSQSTTHECFMELFDKTKKNYVKIHTYINSSTYIFK